MMTMKSKPKKSTKSKRAKSGTKTGLTTKERREIKTISNRYLSLHSHAFILLDRTGSMASRWDEAVNSVNAYIGTLKNEGSDNLATLAVFDEFAGKTQFDVLRDGVNLSEWKPFSADEVAPRGTTPLLDAVMRLVTLAEKTDPKRAVLVVMTDGFENASREAKKADVKAAIERVKAKQWQVVFLGADFDSFSEAYGLGIPTATTMSTTSGHYGQTAHLVALHSADYFASGTSIKFSDKDRKDATGDK